MKLLENVVILSYDKNEDSNLSRLVILRRERSIGGPSTVWLEKEFLGQDAERMYDWLTSSNNAIFNT